MLLYLEDSQKEAKGSSIRSRLGLQQSQPPLSKLPCYLLASRVTPWTAQSHSHPLRKAHISTCKPYPGTLDKTGKEFAIFF